MFINAPSKYDVFSKLICLKPEWKTLVVHIGDYIHYTWKSCMGDVRRSKRRKFCLRLRKETFSENVTVTGVSFEAQGDRPPRGTVVFTERLTERPGIVKIDGYLDRLSRVKAF